MNLTKIITALKNVLPLGDIEKVQEIIYGMPVDFQIICEGILTGDKSLEVSNDDILNIVDVLQFISNNTELPELVSNETYDMLYEYVKDTLGVEVVGSINLAGKKTANHKYPMLRGSLDKVHYILNSDIPKGDNRKSLESWFDRVSHGNANIAVVADKKQDGVSVTFEYNSVDDLDKVLTRGDVDNNIAQDVTKSFIHYKKLEDVFPQLSKSLTFSAPFGVKCECTMNEDQFIKFKETRDKEFTNTRSAVTSFINSDDNTKDDLQYVNIVPLEIASTGPIEATDYDSVQLISLNTEGGIYHYKLIIPDNTYTHLSTLGKDVFDNDSELQRYRNIIEMAREQSISSGDSDPCDGIVFTLINLSLIEAEGRRDNINKFQIAYKFPAGVYRSRVTDIQFSTGASGKITPVVNFEPIVVFGNTLSNTSIGSINKFEQLGLRVGDEIIIKYDIIPVLIKDDTCATVDGEPIKAPEVCPVCGGNVEKEGLNLFCKNEECSSRKLRSIRRYIQKLNIKHLGDETIALLNEHGFLNSIGDLYRLATHVGEIAELKGMGVKGINKIIKSITDHSNIYPHEFLGSLGIPLVGRKVMKKICKEVDFDTLLVTSEYEGLYKVLCRINGVGRSIADSLLLWMDNNMDNVLDILQFITIKPYDDKDEDDELENPSESVVFTGVRDKEFEKFLKGMNVLVADKYSKKVDVVITAVNPKETTKIKSAREDGKMVIDIETAKLKYGYAE